MKRKMIFILTVLLASLTIVSCNKLTGSKPNPNLKIESPTPLPVPAEIERFVPPKVGAYDLKPGQFYSSRSSNRYPLVYVNRENADYKVNFDIQELSETEAKKWVLEVENDTKKKARALKQCTPQQEDAAGESTDQMPYRLIKKIKHPNGSDIVVFASGYNIFGNCYSTNSDYNNLNAKAIWAEGKYRFDVNTGVSVKEDESKQILDKFFTDYFTAISRK